MKLSDISVKRPVFATVLSLIILVFGVLSYTQLPVREFPAIDVPVVSIDSNYRGAAAAVIETRITQVIEDRISGIEGVRSISSSSRDGRAAINIEFNVGRNIDAAANDVRERVSGVLDNLPEDADPPEIQKVETDAEPIIFLNFIGKDKSRLEITDYAERFIVDRLSAIDGVARVQVNGAQRPAMRVWLNRRALAAFNMTVADVENALRRQNVELPAGRLESTARDMSVRVNRNYQSPEQFRQLVLRKGDDGYLVRLGDVAQVAIGAENPYNDFRGNGESQVALAIIRQSNANSLDVADRIAAATQEIQKTLPKDYELLLTWDTTVFIREAIKSVYRTLIEASVLVVIVIFVFLGSLRATLIPAITVPICLIGACTVLAALGYSINLLTLLALVLAIGLVVDDAIVVLENIYHRIEQGEPPLLAAYNGARQVGFAVVATTIVVCAVFVPVVFISGTTGKLFAELSGAMIGAVALSGFVALTLTPMLCSKILKKDRKRHRFNDFVDTRFNALSNWYRGFLNKVVDRTWLVAGSALGVVLLCLLVGRTLPSELAPQEDVGTIWMNVNAAEGTGFNAMKGYMGQVEDILLPKVGEGPIRRVLVRVPGNFGGGETFNSGGATVLLKDWSERDVSTQDVIEQLQRELRQIPGVRANAFTRSGLAGGRGAPVSFVISGTSYDDLAVARDGILKAAEGSGLFGNIDADYKETRPQLILDINTTRAGDLGVSATAIGQTLETLMGSRRVTTYIDRGEEYYVMLQAGAGDRITPDDVANTYVRSERTGEMVPLSNLVTMKESAVASTLGRYNKLRSITISGTPAQGVALGDALNFLEVEAAKFPDQVGAIGYRGESLEYKESGNALYFVLGLAILIVYLVLAAQFESFIHPFVIIMTVPLAVGGALLGLWVMGSTLNIYSQVGIIMLVGLAAKNGILIVEFANQLRDTGLSVRDAIIGAAERRLRPVLMTSIATVAGAIPLMLASGAGAASRETIGVVIVFGVSLATLLTLVVIPALYAKLAPYTGSPEAVAKRLAALEERQLQGQAAE
jgi:multidrug efflux pump